ncbi:unnamed protein product [Rotaria sordida]|uniref:Signal peptidase complex catalytic subunit SEC11 n=1 Tax=Rotaria sordida TaxID=392033 RepID=A0A819IRQ5_9BILA|nr:unnamed protein product [Rotaria sordida]
MHQLRESIDLVLRYTLVGCFQFTYQNRKHVSLTSVAVGPAFNSRGNFLLLTNYSTEFVRAGDIVVFRIEGRDIPTVHRVIKVHGKNDGYVKFLTKGDTNQVDDRGLYSPGQLWLERKDIIGTADLFNINIQYCMSLPQHALQSLEINRVTQVRVLGDYCIHIVKNISQWKIGISPILANAFGLGPFKDIFWSNEFEPGAPYRTTVRESLSEREILIATLSTGSVAFRDGINYIDTTRTMRCCRQDGLILKPSKPLTTNILLISDWTFNKGITQGELYSTKAMIKNQIFSIIFASSMERNYSLIPSMIGSSSSGLIYSLLWYFNDSLSTKYAFMGELNEWRFISQQRFYSLTINSDNIQMIIMVKGVPNELVDILVHNSKFESILHLICHFSDEKLQAPIIINSTNITRS